LAEIEDSDRYQLISGQPHTTIRNHDRRTGTTIRFIDRMLEWLHRHIPAYVITHNPLTVMQSRAVVGLECRSSLVVPKVLDVLDSHRLQQQEGGRG
jgi:hypothetical protein